jgi:hypothetical protein
MTNCNLVPILGVDQSVRLCQPPVTGAFSLMTSFRPRSLPLLAASMLAGGMLAAPVLAQPLQLQPAKRRNLGRHGHGRTAGCRREAGSRADTQRRTHLAG